MFSPRYWSVMAVALLACSLATPLPSPQAGAGKDLADALSSALGAKAPASSFRVDVRDAPAIQDGAESSADNDVEGDDPKRQLSPATQSFLSTLGTALGPIVGAIVGPLLTNIGQNLSAGSGAQAIAQLQQAAQAAVAAQQQQQQGGSALGVAAAAAVEVSGAGPSSTTPSSPSPTTPSPSSPRPRPQTARPTRRPGARPSQRPGVDSTSPAPAPSAAPAPSTASSPSVASSAAAHQSFDAFVLDVPGKGPFLFLMTPNASAAEQSAAIKQAQQQAAQLLAVDGQSSPIGGVASLIGTTPRPQVTKPTSVGPLPVHPVVSVTPPPPPPNPLPSYHSLLGDNDDEQDQQGEEEVAVETAPVPHDLDEQRAKSDVSEAKEDDGDFSSQSFLERLFPEMM